jgi:hypothetical protein
MLKPFASPRYLKRTRCGSTGDECCVCGKPTSGLNGAIHVPVNHENATFVTDAEAEKLGDAVSLYPIGPECAKKWSKEFAATSSRLRRTRGAAGDIISYDHQARRA